MILSATNIHSNRAVRSGAQVYIGNVDVFATLPVAFGHYLQGTFVCKALMCKKDSSCKDQCAYELCASGQYCPYQMYNGTSMLSLTKQQGIDEDWPPACHAGFIATSMNVTDQSSPICSGACKAGSYCPQGALMPEPCPVGTSSAAGGASQADCTPCPPGYYARVPGSAECTRCPPGTFQSEMRGTACQACPVGHYCLSGSAAGIPCRDGTFDTAGSLSSSEQCVACIQGHWCNSGKSFPCAVGFYTEDNASSDARTDLSACLPCPLHSTTPDDASASVRACVCQKTDYLDEVTGDGHNATCRSCPSGTLCNQDGTTLASLCVKVGFWRSSQLSRIAKPCPYPSTCASGATTDVRYNRTGNATCAPDLGVAGVYCMLCQHPRRDYFSQGHGRCVPCSNEIALSALVVVGLLLLPIAAIIIARNLKAHPYCQLVWQRLGIAARAISLQVRLLFRTR